MTTLDGNPISDSLLSQWIHFRDFEVSWVGENPCDGGLIFGSDDGRIRTTGIDRYDGPAPDVISPTGEAINSVAFAGNTMAVSTRSDISFIDLGPQFKGPTTIFRGGTHGVASTSAGGFVAPLGLEGLLLMNPKPGPTQSIRIFTPANGGVNIYKMARLLGDGSKDLFACAARRGGLLAVTIGSDGPAPARSFKSPGLDVVDVCSLGTPEQPRAIVGLGVDGCLHLTSDLLDGRPPITLRFNALAGTPYTIRHEQGCLLLLTSRGVYTFPDLATSFLDGSYHGGQTRVHFLPFRAIDIFLVHGRLLVVEDKGVISVPIENIANNREKSGESVSESLQAPVLPTLPWDSVRDLEWTWKPAA